MNRDKGSLARNCLRGAADALVSVLFPSPCHVCHRPLATASRIPVCAECLNSLRPIGSPVCRQCGRPFPPGRGATPPPLCHACQGGIYHFDLARSLVRYDHTMERVITLLKYSPSKPLAGWLARQIEPVIRAEPAFQQVSCVVPVPLDRTRRRQRGYNQAELIARPLARRLGLPLATGRLRRLRPRPSRLKLSRRERWETVRGAFQAEPGGQVDRAHLLLVDDVMTSGATLDACARALRSAGAEAVYAVTAARVLPAGELDPPGATL